MKSELLATPIGGGGSDSEFLVTVEHAVILDLNTYGFNRIGEVSSDHFGSISPDTITVNGLTQDIYICL